MARGIVPPNPSRDIGRTSGTVPSHPPADCYWRRRDRSMGCPQRWGYRRVGIHKCRARYRRATPIGAGRYLRPGEPSWQRSGAGSSRRQPRQAGVLPVDGYRQPSCSRVLSAKLLQKRRNHRNQRLGRNPSGSDKTQSVGLTRPRSCPTSNPLRDGVGAG